MKPITVLHGLCCAALTFCSCSVDRLTIGRIDVPIDPSIEADAQDKPSASEDGSVPAAENCGGDTYSATVGRLDILALYDDSASMQIPTSPLYDANTQTTVASSVWTTLQEAMRDFIKSDQSKGIGMGLRWFSDYGCHADDYAVPDILIDTLPANADKLLNAIDTHLLLPWVNTATQTKYAIEGATKYLRQLAEEHPGGRHIVLLITDGEPGVGTNDDLDDKGNCASQGLENSNIDNTMQAAKDAFDASIPVYVLGAGWSLDKLHQIAEAGGTKQAFIVDPNKGVKPILSALNDIRSKALPCDYSIPKEYADYNDPTLVNLNYNDKRVGYVASARQCHPEKGGWYYDNPARPTRILACEKTCESLAQGGQVHVVLGCPRVVLY